MGDRPRKKLFNPGILIKEKYWLLLEVHTLLLQSNLSSVRLMLYSFKEIVTFYWINSKIRLFL